MFLNLAEVADADCAREFAGCYERAFRWYVAGYVHKLDLEYDCQPHALVMVEVWKTKTGRRLIGVQHDDKRREIPSDQPPEPPMLLLAGTTVHEFVAPQDLKRMREMGYERFLAALKSGKLKLSPRPLKLLHEDTLINVAPPATDILAEICRDLTGFFGLMRTRRARRVT